MKRKSIFLFILMLLVFWGFTSPTSSQENNPLEKYAYNNPDVIKLTSTSTYDIEYKLTFKKVSFVRVTKVLVRVAVPKNIPPIQEIIEMKAFPDYTKIKVDENGNNIAYFDLGGFNSEKELIIKYRVKVTGFNVKKETVDEELPNAFIEPEKFVESDNPQIKEMSDTICEGKDNVWDKTRAIYDYVGKYVKYSLSWDDLGALYALNKKSGDCSDFSSLMIALCRAQRIPARPINVYYYDEKAEDYLSNSHDLLEVYLPQIGWVPMDPTFGRWPGAGDKYFAGKQDDTVIRYITNSSKLLDGYEGYCYHYWWDRGTDPTPTVTQSLKVIKIE
jgi:transglutaminase-like putative cysteine protease